MRLKDILEKRSFTPVSEVSADPLPIADAPMTEEEQRKFYLDTLLPESRAFYLCLDGCEDF